MSGKILGFLTTLAGALLLAFILLGQLVGG